MNSAQVAYQDNTSIVDSRGNPISTTDATEIASVVASLPAQLAKSDVLHAFRNNQVIMIIGATGCGKSTQIPQILHFAYPKAKIVATQPRIISATSLAERVSIEAMIATGDMSYALGQRVGYRTLGAGRCVSADTRIAYHTTGTELMRQIRSNECPDILIIDEAHGFSIDTEMLMLISRYRKTTMQIVIMSATMDPEIYREYLSRDIPLIQIPGRLHEVISDRDRDMSFWGDLRNHTTQDKNIIMFVPGKKEIQIHVDRIKETHGDLVEVFPLHADIPKNQQDALLIKDGTKPRIIVSTDIAAESITIPYASVVMDLGLAKVPSYSVHGVPSLRIENIALSQIEQRAGRVGRTDGGEYARYNGTDSRTLPEYPTAPIERDMIDRHILMLLSDGIDIITMVRDSIDTGVSPFLHHVDIGLFEISLRRLESIGALTPDHRLTVLGHELLHFPIDVYHARMLYESIERGCAGNMISMVAILEKKGFVSKDDIWKDLLTHTDYSSDLDAYVEILDMVTSSKWIPADIEILSSLGLDEAELTKFYEQVGDKKLYEIVDLSPIGLKNKKIKEIDECRDILLDLLHTSDIDTAPSKKPSKTRDISLSLATGYINNQYTYSTDSEIFTHAHDQNNTDRYIQGDISVIHPKSRSLYLGSPFIIGGDSPADDLYMLTQIVRVRHDVLREATRINTGHTESRYVSHHRSEAKPRSLTLVGSHTG